MRSSFPTDQHVKKQIHSTPRGGLRRIRKAYPYHALLTRLLPAADIEGGRCADETGIPWTGGRITNVNLG